MSGKANPNPGSTPGRWITLDRRNLVTIKNEELTASSMDIEKPINPAFVKFHGEYGLFPSSVIAMWVEAARRRLRRM